MPKFWYEIAVPGWIAPKLHATLLFVGDRAERNRPVLEAAGQEVADKLQRLTLRLDGELKWMTSPTPVLEEREIAYVGVGVVGRPWTLPDIHDALCAALLSRGIRAGHLTSFTPHVTLAKLPTRQYDGKVPRGSWVADRFLLRTKETTTSFLLRDASYAQEEVTG